MAAEELPDVLIVRFSAFMVPPPVVMSPPEQFPLVSITESAMLTTVPSPYENTALACVPFVSISESFIVSVPFSVAKIAEFSP